jgi:DNA modification methylase
MDTKNYREKIGENEYHVFYKDCKNMSEIPDGKINLIITSPPYFNLKDYTTKPKKQNGQIPSSPEDWNQSYDEYLYEMNQVWKECFRVLSNNGILFINIDVIKFKTKDKNIIPIPFDFINQCSKIGFGCKDILIYKKLTGVPFQIGKKLKNRHEYLLIFSKNNDYKWNIDSIREPYPENYIYPEGHKRRNNIGQAPSSVWEFFPPFQTGGKNHYHYCPFPDGLVDRAIKLFTDKNDFVLDPFLGSGKVVARAKALNRNGIGYEINFHFKNIIENMIREVKNGEALNKERKLINKNSKLIF